MVYVMLHHPIPSARDAGLLTTNCRHGAKDSVPDQSGEGTGGQGYFASVLTHTPASHCDVGRWKASVLMRRTEGSCLLVSSFLCGLGYGGVGRKCKRSQQSTEDVGVISRDSQEYSEA